MPVIQQRYQTGYQTGPIAVSELLGAWMKTRQAMNEAARATGAGEDPAALAKQEADVRDRIARLRGLQGQYEASRRKTSGGISEKAMEVWGRLEVANIDAATKRMQQKAAIQIAMQEQEQARARDFTRKTAFDPATLTPLDGMNTEVETRGLNGVDAAAEYEKRFGDAWDRAGRPAPGTAAYDQLAYLVWDKAGELPASDEARAIFAKRHFGGADPAQYMVRTYTKDSAELVRQAEDIAKTIGGGGVDATAAVAQYEKTFGLPRTAAEEAAETSVRSQAASLPGGATSKADADMDQAVKDLETFADELAARRRAAGARQSAFPAGNYYYQNPNTFVSERGMRQVRRFGEAEPEYSEAAMVALDRAGGRPQRALLEVEAGGGLESNRRRDYRPEMVGEGGGTLGQYLAQHLNAGSATLSENGWTWEWNPDDRSYTVKDAPVRFKPSIGKTFKPGDPQYEGVRTVLKGKHPDAAAEVAAVLAAQPAEVQGLFAPAIAELKAGDLQAARAALADVNPADMRTAYARALQEGDAVAVERGLAAMPEEERGAWGRAVLDRLSTVPNTHADRDAVAVGLREIGDAMVTWDREVAPRQKALEKQATAEEPLFQQQGPAGRGRAKASMAAAELRKGSHDDDEFYRKMDAWMAAQPADAGEYSRGLRAQWEFERNVPPPRRTTPSPQVGVGVGDVPSPHRPTEAEITEAAAAVPELPGGRTDVVPERAEASRGAAVRTQLSAPKVALYDDDEADLDTIVGEIRAARPTPEPRYATPGQAPKTLGPTPTEAERTRAALAGSTKPPWLVEFGRITDERAAREAGGTK